MRPNNQFVASLHILSMLTLLDKPATSQFISTSTGLNEVTIRKLLLRLKEAGMVTTRKGPAGGSELSRTAETITLEEIFSLFREDAFFGAYLETPSKQCPIGKNLQGCLEQILEPPVSLFLGELKKISVADVARSIQRTSGL